MKKLKVLLGSVHTISQFKVDSKNHSKKFWGFLCFLSQTLEWIIPVQAKNASKSN